MLYRMNDHIRHIEHIVAFFKNPIPCRLVIPRQELEIPKPPMTDRIFFNVPDKSRISDDFRTEYRHAPGQSQNFAGQRNG